MAARLGLLLYWVGCAGAAVMVAVGIFAIFAMPNHDTGPFIFFAIMAALIWAAGRGARFVLAGR